jgi:hypothetical protein
MTFLKLRRQARADHVRVERELAEREAVMVDLAIRLVRLEAEVEIYRPFYLDDSTAVEP